MQRHGLIKSSVKWMIIIHRDGLFVFVAGIDRKQGACAIIQIWMIIIHFMGDS
jgi:hypothetical protein